MSIGSYCPPLLLGCAQSQDNPELQSNGNKNGPYITFEKLDRNGFQTQNIVRSKSRSSVNAGITFDGTDYHAIFLGEQQNINQRFPLLLQTIKADGSLGKRTKSAESNKDASPSIEFNGSHLVIAYSADRSFDNAILEIRKLDNHSSLQNYPLPKSGNFSMDTQF